MSSAFRLSVILCSTARPTLPRALASCRGADEVILTCDGGGAEEVWRREALPGFYLALPGPHRDWGAAARTAAMSLATGTHLLFLDDDDWYLDGAFDAVREALRFAQPGQPAMFRMRRPARNDVLWREPLVERGNVSSQMFCVPNHPHIFGRWRAEYAGDWFFIEETLNRHEARQDNLQRFRMGPDLILWCRDEIAVWGREEL